MGDMCFLVTEVAGRVNLTENFRKDQRRGIHVHWIQKVWSYFTHWTVWGRLFLTPDCFSGSTAQTLEGHNITQRLRVDQRRRNKARSLTLKPPAEGDQVRGGEKSGQLNQEHSFDLYSGQDILIREMRLCSLPQLPMENCTGWRKEGKSLHETFLLPVSLACFWKPLPVVIIH